MNLSIVGKQLELTEAIKTHVENGINSLNKYNLDIISTRVVLFADENSGKNSFNAEFAINLAHKNTIVIKQNNKDLYVAIDLAIERAKKVLRRHHDKITNHKIKNIAVAKTEVFDNEDEVVPTRLDSYKPIEIEDALNELKESNKNFFVFIDMDDKMRTIYKKTDNTYGLY
ncbi:MAG: ribosome-associated translation inhibitor RaiA [Sulfurospirillum sp.]|nr:ribosome-associated translation inhibitor RaiA [Sulfurospirillum sp.]MBL0703127.1 ribosome-associated translation inhibitor RaiA [Sulfurospirillum sp.]